MKEFTLSYIQTDKNTADIFTKSLGGELFQIHNLSLGLKNEKRHLTKIKAVVEEEESNETTRD